MGEELTIKEICSKGKLISHSALSNTNNLSFHLRQWVIGVFVLELKLWMIIYFRDC
jgi:hypothetical protein